jgi:hypothetical protein
MLWVTLAIELHASDYQMYAYLQTAQDLAPKRLLDALPAIASRFDPDGGWQRSTSICRVLCARRDSGAVDARTRSMDRRR